jgi:hypothetical protein
MENNMTTEQAIKIIDQHIQALKSYKMTDKNLQENFNARIGALEVLRDDFFDLLVKENEHQGQ